MLGSVSVTSVLYYATTLRLTSVIQKLRGVTPYTSKTKGKASGGDTPAYTGQTHTHNTHECTGPAAPTVAVTTDVVWAETGRPP